MNRITAEKKDEIFRHPKTGTIHFGRHMSVACTDEATWAAVQMGEGASTRVLLVGRTASGERIEVRGPDAMVHQPVIAVGPDGSVAVVWNEATDQGWAVRVARVNTTEHTLSSPVTVRESTGLCMPPTAAFEGEALRIAWAEQTGHRIAILTTVASAQGNAGVEQLSESDVDAFRPSLSSHDGRTVISWDEYREGRYQIVVGQWHKKGFERFEPVGAVDERWLSSRCLVTPKGEAYVVWVVLKPVIDKLGIVDHWPMGVVARLENEGLHLLHDTDHPGDTRIAADLRDGLLASKIYKGYVGLRRQPQLSSNAAGALWCVWESRGESEGSTVAGPLLARRLGRDDRWQPPCRLAESGYGYAAAERFEQDVMPFASMTFDAMDTDVIHLGQADPRDAVQVTFDESRWQRWQVQPVKAEQHDVRSVDIDDQTYQLFWADTHVHSVFSPDAEGELDELAHFARDQAGLHIVTIIDNDYYPHKALTEPEWRIHQALAAHFSQEDRFLWLPGYEFTYHRGDLSPDFNHRCVSYPSGRGPLHRRIDPQTNTDHKMIPTLEAAGAMIYPHHCTYELIDNAAEWNVEVTSSWRVCIEETDFTIGQLRDGRRLGFIGSSDTHRAVPGLGGARTGVLATQLTREAVLDAYRNRRLIATQGHNLSIDFRINGVPTGGEVVTSDKAHIVSSIHAPLPIDFVEVVRDGRPILTLLPASTTCEIDLRDTPSSGDHFYFLRIKLVGDPSFNRDGDDPATADPRPFSQVSRYPHNLARARGPYAWSSPIWVTTDP